MKKNESWLNVSILIHIWTPNTNPGRPSKNFQKLTDRSKRRKTKEVRDEVRVEVLTFAASVSQHTSGNAANSLVMQKNSVIQNQRQFEFRRHVWKLCSKTYWITQLKDCLYLEDVLQCCTIKELENLELISRWECDGSHQTTYQQKFLDSSHDDTNIFQSSLVPLRLQYNHELEKKKWRLYGKILPTPSSTRFCRPIRIWFLHETVDITNDEVYRRSNEPFVKDRIRKL